MTVIPCEQNTGLRDQIEQFAEVLKTQAHVLGQHGLDEKDFYNSGLFRGAIERIRGQFSATTGPKREFVRHILNFMEDSAQISGWEASDAAERNDYWVHLPGGRNAVIALTGAMDGQNTTIFERPDGADEFIIWSIATNPGGDPRRNAWSGIHTRLSAEMVATGRQIDGVVIWDMYCGTAARPCPKMDALSDRWTNVGPFRVPPPCLYVFPSVAPGVASPKAQPQMLAEVSILQAFHNCFRCNPGETNFVAFEVEIRGGELSRKTTVSRGGVIQRSLEMTPLRRG